LAVTETTVLITGDSGTGKELVAEAIHYSGPRALKPLVKVNCSALSENLLESELFGHVRGAFTGAIRDKVGRFQLAEGGSILLDEIGDISPAIQLKLLRVLQEKVCERVGDSLPMKVDVRVLAATNRDLQKKVLKGEFREDLYYRLKVVKIALPALRDRLADIPLLVEHFCARFNRSFNKNISGISPEVMKAFMKYTWPGNIRELEHALEHAFVVCHEPLITCEHLPQEIMDYGRGKRSAFEAPGLCASPDIIEALKTSGGNKAKAARALGMSRQTLYRKMKEYKIDDPSG
ncbi:MAG: sigma 54-interacting transcriptional regulator, partial [Pseudomonadota bacterium]